MDCANAIEAVLQAGGSWREVRSELSGLLQWAESTEEWEKAGLSATELRDESCKVPQVASALIGIIWTTVRKEIPLLLEGLSARIADLDQLVPAWRPEAQLKACHAELRHCLQSRIRQRSELLSAGEQKPQTTATLEDLRRRLSELDALAALLGDPDRMQARTEDIGQQLQRLGEGAMDGAWHERIRSATGDPSA